VARKLAVSGIPAHWMRNIAGQSSDFKTLYNEVPPRVSLKKHVDHEVSRIANTGNYLIGEGVRYAFGGSSIQHIPLPWLLQQNGGALIEYINSTFDAFIFGTANIFRKGSNPANEVSVFSKLRIPIVMMSAGIQNQDHFGTEYPEHYGPLLDVIKERKIFVFTRGFETANFLRSHGVKFAEPVGCPSLYAFPSNFKRSLKGLKDVDPTANLTVTHSGYLGSVRDTVVDINAIGGKSDNAFYVSQDEMKLFDYRIEGADDRVVYSDATGEILAPVSFPGAEALKRKVQHFVFFNTEQWRAWISRCDLAFGRRFHGGVIAAQAGVPAVWIAVDGRTREMLRYIQVPHFEASEWNREPNKQARLAEFIQTYDADKAVEHYSSSYTRFRTLLREIGLQ
jgi:hypothetical protein